MGKLLLALISIVAFSISAYSAKKLKPAAIFSDNMVLESGKEITVWGDAAPNADVTVAFAGQKVSAMADKNGFWEIKLSPLSKSSKEQTMTISSGEEKITAENAIVGDVWVCSGQSNMDYTISGLRVQYGKPVIPLAEAAKSANFPLIRQFSFKHNTSFDKPIRNFKGKWIICDPKSVDRFTGVGFFFARELHKNIKTPIGLIKVAWGGTPVEAWTRHEVLLKDERGKKYIPQWEKTRKNYNAEEAKKLYKDHMAKWEAAEKVAKETGKKNKVKKPGRWRSPYKDPVTHTHYPSTLYNGMIYPILKYAISGVIWYQGETNVAGSAKYYGETFKSMIRDWRRQWGQGDFPFYFVQLANFASPSKTPRMDSWGVLRQQQLNTLELPNTGMAVIIDIGEAKDIHPRNKIDVGKRLALWALNKDYNKKDIVYSGPLYKSYEIKGSEIIIKFSETGSGLMVGNKETVWTPVLETNGDLKQFQIAGKDKVWKWAKARIISNTEVKVWEESIPEPQYVRYATQVNPEGANLYNKEKLPASPFSTEK